jgi:hypothetical protein
MSRGHLCHFRRHLRAATIRATPQLAACCTMIYEHFLRLLYASTPARLFRPARFSSDSRICHTPVPASAAAIDLSFLDVSSLMRQPCQNSSHFSF